MTEQHDIAAIASSAIQRENWKQMRDNPKSPFGRTYSAAEREEAKRICEAVEKHNAQDRSH